jgi:putative hydrolase of the HAD superfamily
MTIRALTLDLDDTLWPIAPVMQRAEQALDDWLHAHCPEVAIAWPIETMRNLRERMWLMHPQLAHDFTALRKLSLRHVFTSHSLGEEWVERAFEVFYAARNRVELYPEAGAALERLSARWPLASVSNGNADLERIGLGPRFRAIVSARGCGYGKPDPRIFRRAASLLGVPLAQIAHVGDDPELDVQGALEAGMVAVWLNRDRRAWPYRERPTLEITTLDQLEPALDAHVAARAPCAGHAA